MENSKSKRMNVRFSEEQYNKRENYRKEHKIPYFSQAEINLSDIGLESVEIIKRKDEENSLLKEEIGRKEKTIELLRQGISEDMHEISEKPCPFLVYVDGLKVCGDVDAPIPSYLKKDLTAQICVICRTKKALREKEQKVAEKPKRSISKIDKKKAKKIYCYGLHREVTLDYVKQHQAMCLGCNRRALKEWTKCMQARVPNE